MNRQSGERWSDAAATSVRPPRRYRLVSAAATIAAHVLALFILIRAVPPPHDSLEPAAVSVSLVPPPEDAMRPTPGKTPSGRAPARGRAPAKSVASRHDVKPTSEPDALDLGEAQPVDLTEDQLAGALTAGSGPGGDGGDGSGGRPCDMVRRLQNALRRDASIQAAVADARRVSNVRGGAIMLWNGDWVRSPGQDGKGLAGVRQAIVTEIAFAPEACRAQSVHGLVLLSLNDGPGAARLALGSGAWRWSDLLFAR